jgi:hypothetical protein
MTLTQTAPMARRPFLSTEVDYVKVVTTIAILTVLMALFAALVWRGFLARQPEIGGAVPIEELREAWAEEAREAGVSAPKITSPMSHEPEHRK